MKILNLLMEIMRSNCHLFPEMRLLRTIICQQKKKLEKLSEHFYENKDVLYEYDSIIEYQKQKKLIEKAPENNPIGKCDYLPHHPAIRPEKLTKKMRMVFDTSSKSGGEKSLNECLYPGPPLTAELFGVLLRFRVFNVTVVGGIEKAFL